MSIDPQLTIYRFLRGYGDGLLADIDAGDAFRPVAEGGHHPAWIVGHLATIGGRGIAMLGGDSPVDDNDWGPRFGIASEPSVGQADGPGWEELVGAWHTVHEVTEALVGHIADERLDAPNPIERRRDVLPTVRDMAGFVFTAHESLHLGQLSAWRRVQGRPRLF
ncbi:MAG: DinB family protein [Planctomycetota bacterium]